MSSLLSALSGLKANQNWMDVIGNNLANTNTSGFKSSRASFSDSMTRTLRYASQGLGGQGGVNPMQIGSGVSLSSISNNFSQGSLTTTGRTFDLALQGNGFFALSDGSQSLYSRTGTFGLDVNQNMVDQRSGYQVLDSTGQAISLDMERVFPPQGTGTVGFAGTLPAVVTGPLAEILTGAAGLSHGYPATLVSGGNQATYSVGPNETWEFSVVVNSGAAQEVSLTSDGAGNIAAADIAAAIDNLDDVSAALTAGGNIEIVTAGKGSGTTLQIQAGSAPNDLASLVGLSTLEISGTETDITATTDLSDLPANSVPYAVGDQIVVSGEDTDGTAINAVFTYGVDGTTVNEFVSYLDGLYTDASVSLNASGQIVVEAQTAGDADLLLSISDDNSATGSTDWSSYATSVTTAGAGPDKVTTSTEVYTAAGVAHTLTLSFERQEDGTWNLIPSVPTEEGTVQSSPITGITFDEDGTPLGLAGLDTAVSIQWAAGGSQSVQVDLGQDGTFEGLTQFGSAANAWIDEQDGYGQGELANLQVLGDGNIEGYFTNGQVATLASVGVALFANDNGLQDAGGGMWLASANSGSATLGNAQAGNAATITGGALENSNVDTAEQFVRLIEAQRGFQANARIITTQDELLAEAVNLI
ncbi:MAG: flagellar hook-basal body complex protein [Planctomycetota bacterium]|jgi:flagellar hook protein FlgE|nr:flagellar hook-basal body complex protein [Planctomycetota bacterium]